MLEVGNAGLTDVQMRSHFSLWAVMAAPLLAGTDLRTASAATKAIYLNRDVIAVDQDPLGEQGREIYLDGARHVIVKPLAGGDRAVALFNESDTAQTMSSSANAVGVTAASTYTVTDLWSKVVGTTTAAFRATVPPYGTVLLRIHPSSAGAGGWTRSLLGEASGKCLDDPGSATADGTQVVIWGGCHGLVNEQWTYTAKKQLVVLNKCLQPHQDLTVPGTKVELQSCDGRAGQQWTPNADGTVTAVRSGLCLDVIGNATDNLSPVGLWTCHATANQIWNRR
jgi:alpha-galactosidase